MTRAADGRRGSQSAARRSRRPDRREMGFSSIVGFMAAMVVLVGSTAAVVYVIANQPDPAAEQGTQRLHASATRALDALVTQPGFPTDWHTKDLEDHPPLRIGLLEDHTSDQASWDKVHAFQNGSVTHEVLLDALDLKDEDFSLHVSGKVVSNPLLDPPDQDGWSIVHATQSGSDSAVWTPTADSAANITRFCGVNSQCPSTFHDWAFGMTQHPSTGLGDQYADHAWFVETQMIPAMTGVRATYTMTDLATNTTGPNQDGENNAFDDYDGSSDPVTGWHIFEAGNPDTIPSNDSMPDGDHAFTVTTKKQNAGGAGWGLWKSKVGTRSVFTLGPYDISDAEELELDFHQTLKHHPTQNIESRARILFWNQTADSWQDLEGSEVPKGCDTTSLWDNKGLEAGSFTQVSTQVGDRIDLCEAVHHGGSQLWLAFYWDSWCVDGSGDWKKCPANQHKNGRWFIDDLNIYKTVNGEEETLFHTSFEPDPENIKEMITISSAVDLDRVAAAPHVEHVADFITNAVKAGTNLLALEPGTEGDLLGAVGLDAKLATHTGQATTVKEDIGIMRLPNTLPASSAEYEATTHGWSTGITSHPTAGSPANQLTVIAQVLDSSGSGDGTATVLTGRPFPDGGTVTAITYDLADMTAGDPDLAEDFIENVYASTVFRDPTFALADRGDTVPKPGTSEVASARRIALVSITEDDLYSIPVEITLYLWPLATG